MIVCQQCESENCTYSSNGSMVCHDCGFDHNDIDDDFDED